FRQSYLGTSIAERISQFRETFSSVKHVGDRLKDVKTVEETTLASGETLRTIKTSTVVRNSWNEKIAVRATLLERLKGSKATIQKFDEAGTKVVKGFKEVQQADGTYKIESTFRTVYRERYLK